MSKGKKRSGARPGRPQPLRGTKGKRKGARLALEISKSRDVLGFSPRWSLQESIARTINWYRAFLGGKNALELCLDDVSAYEGR